MGPVCSVSSCCYGHGAQPPSLPVADNGILGRLTRDRLCSGGKGPKRKTHSRYGLYSSVLFASDKLHSHSNSGLIKVEVIIDHEKKNN